MPTRPQYISGLTGRRAYLRYQFGSHFWQPLVENSWVRGIVRDTPRVAIPAGGVYDSTDFLLHKPGVASKRGGTSRVATGLASSYVAACGYVPFPTQAQLVAIGNDGDLAGIPIVGGVPQTAGVVSVALGAGYATKDTPKFWIGGGKNYLVVTSPSGSIPKRYTGTGASSVAATAPAAKYAEVYKSRLVLGNTTGKESRLYFSPVPDITTTWDTTNSWIDCDHAITGIAALSNVLLVFSLGNTERIIGSTPPPGSDMDRAPLTSVGCTDARSIVKSDGNVFFANPRGVYFTNGAGVQSLTTLGGIESYWQSLLADYDPATWTISAGVFRSFFFVSIIDNNGALVDSLCCYLPGRSWWRNTNMLPMMYAPSYGAEEELYYADRSSAYLVSLSGIFNPTAANKDDGNGLPVQPTIEFRPQGYGPSEKRYGAGRVSYDLRDAATDTPTLAVVVKMGAEADVSVTPAAGTLAATTTNTRSRFVVARESQAATVQIAQSGPSSKTEIYAVEVEQRGLPYADLDTPA